MPSCSGVPFSYVIEAGSAPGLRDLASFSTGSTATEFAASNIAAWTYYVRVRARNDAGVGLVSNEVVLSICSVPPGAPAGLRAASAAVGTVTLNWSAATGPVSTYLIEVGSRAGQADLRTVDLGSTSTTLSASDVPRGTYFVRVRARNGCGTSAPSNEITVTVS